MAIATRLTSTAQKFSVPALFEGANPSDQLQCNGFAPAPPKFSVPAVFQGVNRADPLQCSRFAPAVIIAECSVLNCPSKSLVLAWGVVVQAPIAPEAHGRRTRLL